MMTANLFVIANVKQLPFAAPPDMHWFKWTAALLFPQRSFQGHGTANAASRDD